MWTKCNGFESSYSMGVSFAVIGWERLVGCGLRGGAVAWGVEGSESWWSTSNPQPNTSQPQRPPSPPAMHERINLYGRYDFTNPAPPPTGQLRPLRTP